MRMAAMVTGAMRWTSRQLQRRVPYAPDNPYLLGPYGPVTEERSETALAVTGVIPRELNGVYVRIGPNPVGVDNPATYHWFLGDGMVHGVRLRDGAAQWYRNRYVAADDTQRRLGRPLLPGRRHNVIDVVNTNVFGHAGRIWALVESGPLPVALDAGLESVGRSLFASDLDRGFSAHPHRDPQTGRLHAICYSALDIRHVHHVVVEPDGRVSRVEAIPVRHGPMVHDCALTVSSVVVLDLPITFSFREMLRGYPFPYRWNPKHVPRVGLLPKTGSAKDMRWFEVEPCFVYHPCNARDTADGGAIVDVLVHTPMFDRAHYGPEETRRTFERWTLDARSGRVKRDVLSDHAQEFPRCDERRTGSDYRYAYTVGVGLEPGPQPLYRHDLQSGVTTVQRHGPHHVAGEAVFVPRSVDSAEDDGWVLSFVYDLQARRSALVILDASDPGGEPVASVSLPVPVPLGFHGNWIPDPV